MNPKGLAITFLLIFLGLAPCFGEPFRHQDTSSTTPWAAHLDLTKLQRPPLDGFLLQVAGFDRILQLQTVLRKELAIDWQLFEGVTLFGAGDQLSETAIIIRGDLKNADLTNFPITNKIAPYHGVQLRQGPEWQKSPLIFARQSDNEWIAGTSQQTIKNSMDLIAGRMKGGSVDHLSADAAKEIEAAAAMFALDMEQLNGELEFEADFTRAIQRAWFLIGSKNDLVEATLMIDSTDAEGLLFLQKQFQLLPVLLMSKQDCPAIWLELATAIRIETKGNWMTLKVAASPKKAAEFLKSLAPLFIETPGSATPGN